MASEPDEIKTICECQYALALSDGGGENARETKDSFSVALNVHEIDEEDSEVEENVSTSVRLDLLTSDKKDADSRGSKDALEDESAYTGEPFCSDESCDEESSEITNVTPGSLASDSSSLLPAAAGVVDGSRGWNDDGLRDDESYSPSEAPTRAVTADISSRRCRRWNMSFTDEEMRKIERDNEHLLRKIMAQQKPRHKILGERTVQPRVSSSAINRRKLQKKIEDDNMLLLRRIQQAKSCVLTNASKTSCRLTFL